MILSFVVREITPKDISNLMGNRLKLELCFILREKKLSLNEIVEAYEQKYGTKKYRETIFRALQEMLKSELIEKTYDQQRKKIQYHLLIRGLLIDFAREKIESIEESNQLNER